jgi:DUF2934 family protein
MATREDEIRIRAHELWERAGSPEGKADAFWYAAEGELAQEPQVDASGDVADVLASVEIDPRS